MGAVCRGAQVILGASVTNGGTPLSYQWQNNENSATVTLHLDAQNNNDNSRLSPNTGGVLLAIQNLTW